MGAVMTPALELPSTQRPSIRQGPNQCRGRSGFPDGGCISGSGGSSQWTKLRRWHRQSGSGWALAFFLSVRPITSGESGSTKHCGNVMLPTIWTARDSLRRFVTIWTGHTGGGPSLHKRRAKRNLGSGVPFSVLAGTEPKSPLHMRRNSSFAKRPIHCRDWYYNLKRTAGTGFSYTRKVTQTHRCAVRHGARKAIATLGRD